MSRAVVISGKPGAGNSTVGKLLSKKLDYEFFSAGDYFKSYSKNKKETQSALEVLNTKEGSSDVFHNKIESIQKELAENGDVVIESKLGVHFLKDYCFTVWLTCPFTRRAKRYSEKDDIDLKEAKKQLKEKEEKERKMWKKIYGFDYFEEENEADLVVDTSNKKPKKIVEEILEGFL